MKETLLDLILQGEQMLLDRSKPEQDLIYFVAKLDCEERAAIVLAYQNLYNNEPKLNQKKGN